MKSQNGESTKSNKGVLIVVFFIFVALVGFTAFQMGLYNSQSNITQIQNVFADVNGDGKLDLIVNGDIIFNTEQANF